MTYDYVFENESQEITFSLTFSEEPDLFFAISCAYSYLSRSGYSGFRMTSAFSSI